MDPNQPDPPTTEHFVTQLNPTRPDPTRVQLSTHGLERSMLFTTEEVIISHTLLMDSNNIFRHI